MAIIIPTNIKIHCLCLWLSSCPVHAAENRTTNTKLPSWQKMDCHSCCTPATSYSIVSVSLSRIRISTIERLFLLGVCLELIISEKLFSTLKFYLEPYASRSQSSCYVWPSLSQHKTHGHNLIKTQPRGRRSSSRSQLPSHLLSHLFKHPSQSVILAHPPKVRMGD